MLSFLWPIFSSLGTLFYLVPISLEGDNNDEQSSVDYITPAVPWFILFLFLEFLYGQQHGVTLYSLKDTVLSLSLGLLQQLTSMLTKGFFLQPYLSLYTLCQPLHTCLFYWIPPSYQPYLYFFLGLFGVDLMYYWYHRLAHEWHLLWWGHSMHHSGERYNLATALRQGSIQSLFSWVFYLPLAMVGLPPIHFLRHYQLNTLYQFWFHTEAVLRLPWILELILNTASHHRVHHDPPGNGNYGGVFIIWDRLFNTYICPKHPSLPQTGNAQNLAESFRNGELNYRRGVVYGLAQPLDCWDPVRSVFLPLIRLWNVTAPRDKDDSAVFSHLLRFLKLLLSKRVLNGVQTANGAWIADVTFDWQRQNLLRQAAKSPEGLTREEVSQLTSIFQLPNKGQIENGKREEIFLAGRDRREGQLSVFGSCLLTVHFLLTLVFAYGVMAYHRHMMETQVLVAVGISIFSMQLFQFY